MAPSRPLMACLIASLVLPHAMARRIIAQGPWLTGEKEEDLAELALRVGACLDPDAPEAALAGMKTLGQISEDARAGRAAGFSAQLLSTPIDLKMSGVQLGKAIPHLIAGLAPMGEQVSQTADNPQGVPDAACFTHPYSASQGTPDPFGCRTFRKSFEPVAELRACIVPKLKADAKWQAHRTKAKAVKNGTSSKAGATWSEWCTAAFPDCEDYDTLRRAEDIIKGVAFKELPGDAGEYHVHFVRKAGSSKVLEEGAELEEKTAEAIANECFKASDPEAAQDLWKRSQCLPLMYNSLEWGAMGIFDAAVKYYNPPHANNDQPKVVKTHQGVPPVCARLAAGLIAQPFEHTRFGIIANWRNAARQWTWHEHCLHPKKGNCRLFATCWQKAIKRVCALEDSCCEGVERL